MTTATTKSRHGAASSAAHGYAPPSDGTESTGRRKFEDEFLIRLAPVWFACRWKIMGHALRNWPHPSDLAFDLLGCHDNATEMRLLCAEIKAHAPQ